MPTKAKAPKKDVAEKKTVRITVVLDRSGSMMSRTDDTIDAVNNFLNEQAKNQSTKALVSILTFSTDTKWLAKEVNIQHIDQLELNRKNYVCNGNTALFDAVGKAAAEAQKSESPDGIVVIVTDGGENASTEFKLQGVKDIIMQMEQRGWSFIFLGADVNAWALGSAMGVGAVHGIQGQSSSPFTPQNPSIAFVAASDSVSRYREASSSTAMDYSTTALRSRAVASSLTDEERARLEANAAGAPTAGKVNWTDPNLPKADVSTPPPSAATPNK